MIRFESPQRSTCPHSAWSAYIKSHRRRLSFLFFILENSMSHQYGGRSTPLHSSQDAGRYIARADGRSFLSFPSQITIFRQQHKRTCSRTGDEPFGQAAGECDGRQGRGAPAGGGGEQLPAQDPGDHPQDDGHRVGAVALSGEDACCSASMCHALCTSVIGNRL